MERYFVIYKDHVLAGPMPKVDAEQKLIKLKSCFRNVIVVPESQVKKNVSKAAEAG